MNDPEPTWTGLKSRSAALEVYDIAGNTASSMQFYVTDSTHHFLRGSLYFNVAPNIDSMKIVVDFLKTDVLHMIQTFKWKNAQTTISVKK